MSREHALLALCRGPVARGSLVSLTIKLAGLALSFAQAVAAARLLGVAGYGMAAIALSLAQLGATLALFGYGQLAVREVALQIARGETRAPRAFTRQAMGFVALCSLAIGGFTALALVLGSESFAAYRPLMPYVAAIVPAVALVLLFRGIAQGFGDVAGAQWPGEIGRPALILIALGTLVAAGVTVAAPLFLGIVAAAATLCALGGWIVVRRQLARLPVATGCRGAEDRHKAWRADAVAFFWLAVLTTVQAEFATLALAALSSAEQAGLFQPIARLTPLLALPAMAASMRFTPRVAEFWASGQEARLRDVTHTYTIATCALTAATTLAVAGLGPWLLLAFGRDFTAAAPLLWIVGSAQVFNTACGPTGNLLVTVGRTDVVRRGHLAGLVVSLAGAAASIPSHGALGAAVSLAAGIVVWNVWLLVAARRTLGFDPSLLKVLLPSRQFGRSL